MFLFYPIGHDGNVYERPHITWVLVALCVLVSVWMSAVEDSTTDAVVLAGIEVQDLLASDPDLHVSPELVASVPASVRPLLRPLIDDEEVSAELEEAVANLVIAMHYLPHRRLGYTPSNGGLRRAFSSIFAHGGWTHLMGNMILLLLLGGLIEGFWHPAAYVVLYLGAGLAGVALHHLMDPSSAVPLVGASGAIAGVIAAMLIGFAQVRISIGWFVWVLTVHYGHFEIPAWIAASLWGGSQLLFLLMGSEDAVAYGAHVGGFVFGLLFALGAERMGWIAHDAGIIEADPPLGAPL